MIWLFHKTILAEVKRNNDQRGHSTKARFPWSTETLVPRNPFRREGIMTLKGPITRNGPFNDFFSFVISKPNIYCLIRLPFYLEPRKGLKVFSNIWKLKKHSQYYQIFPYLVPREFLKKEQIQKHNKKFLQRNYFTYFFNL